MVKNTYNNNIITYTVISTYTVYFRVGYGIQHTTYSVDRHTRTFPTLYMRCMFKHTRIPILYFFKCYDADYVRLYYFTFFF